jgi:hypothetical protein
VDTRQDTSPLLTRIEEREDSGISVFRAGALKLPKAVFTELKPDKLIFDTGSNFSIVTGRYTAPSNGIYYIFAHCEVLMLEGKQVLIVSILKNGGEAIRGGRIVTVEAGEYAVNVGGLHPLNKGDVVSPMGFQTGPECNLAVSGEGQKNRFSVIRIA